MAWPTSPETGLCSLDFAVESSAIDGARGRAPLGVLSNMKMFKLPRRYGAAVVVPAVCAALLSVLTWSPARAADPDAPPTLLDTVVVTATGQPTALGDVLAPVQIITRDQIELAQAGDLAELLRFFAGVELGRNGGPGQVTSVFIRGGESNHTLVLVDGVRVNPATSGGAALQNIAPESIERIEVVKGPRATLYGSDAIGGVINVITRGSAAADGSSVGGSLRGGSFGTIAGAVRGRYNGERLSATLQAEHEKVDGFPALKGFDDDTGYERDSVNADARYRLGAATIGARLWDARGDVEYYGFDADFNRAVVSQQYRNQTGALDVTLPLGERVSSTLQATRTLDRIDQKQSDDRVETRRHALDAALVYALDAHRISTGINLAREDVEALNFGTAIDQRRDIVALRAQDEWQAGRHRAVIGGSLTDYEGFGGRVDGSLDYGYDWRDGTRLLASAGTGFRAPDATDRFGFGGNPDLDPEKARNYELGVQQRLGAHQRADLRVFRSDVDDLINTLCDADFNCTSVNVDRYRNTGVELSYQLTLQQWSAYLSGIHQDPEDRATGDTLLRRARRSAALKLSRRIGRYQAGVDVLASGARQDFGGVRLGGYTLLNLTAGAELTRRCSLQLRVENLFDKDYETADTYRQPERSYYATLRYAY